MFIYTLLLTTVFSTLTLFFLLQSIKINPFLLLVFLGVLAIVGVSLLFFLKYIWFIGMVFSPFILGGAFFVHRETVLSHFRQIGETVWKNPLRGLLDAALNVMALPLVSFYLLIKAVFFKKIAEMKQQNPFEMFGNEADEKREQAWQQERKSPNVGEYIDFEEIE